MRFREDTPKEQRRARAAVADWRDGHPGGTVDEMVAAVGPAFHHDYGPFLRIALVKLDERRAKDAGTAPAGTEAGSR